MTVTLCVADFEPFFAVNVKTVSLEIAWVDTIPESVVEALSGASPVEDVISTVSALETAYVKVTMLPSATLSGLAEKELITGVTSIFVSSGSSEPQPTAKIPESAVSTVKYLKFTNLIFILVALLAKFGLHEPICTMQVI